MYSTVGHSSRIRVTPNDVDNAPFDPIHARVAYELLGQFDPSLTTENATSHFAHVNTAKCSVNNPGRREAPDRLMANCRGYLVTELKLLQPHVVVTQGAKARAAILDQFRVHHVEEL